MSSPLIPLYRFWQPRYWGEWLGIGILRLIVWLPQPARMAIGRMLGRLARRFVAQRRHVVERNLEICFPELSADECEQLMRRHFESLGMGVVELGMAWCCSDAELSAMTEATGVEHILAALEAGRGCLMLSAHFSSMEINGRTLAPLIPPMSAMYRPSNNPLTDQVMRRVRGKTIRDLIAKDSVRTMLKALRSNAVVWYAADQAYSRRGTVLVDFFGEPAMTNTATSQIAKVSGAPVVPYFPLRVDNGRSYRFDILPALDNFPSDDPAADALRINKLLEERIRIAPEQYHWVHRRFKGRPDHLPDPY